MQWCRTVVVCFLVVTAGCSALDAGSDHPRADASSTSHGIDVSGVDASALVAAHEESIDGHGVILSVTRATASEEMNRTVRTHVWTNRNGTTRRVDVFETDSDSRRVEYWWGADGGYRRVDATVPTTVQPPGSSTARYRTKRLEYWLTAGQYSVSTDPSAQARFVLTADEFSNPGGGQLEADTVRYEASGIVTRTGRIVAFSARLVTIERNKWGRHRRSQTYTYRVVETGPLDIERPAWLGTSEFVRDTDG